MRQVEFNEAAASFEAAGGEEPEVGDFILKEGSAFMVSDERGDAQGMSAGLFCDDTRQLALWRLRVGARTPLRLASSHSEDGASVLFKLANRAMGPMGQGEQTKEGALLIERQRCLSAKGALFERVRIKNWGAQAALAPISVEMGFDFCDLFEARGVRREKRGELRPTQLRADGQTRSYLGLDGVERLGFARFSPAPARQLDGRADFAWLLEPGEEATLWCEAGFWDGAWEEAEAPSEERFELALGHQQRLLRSRREQGARIWSAKESIDDWMARSRADLALLTADLPSGPYPHAGSPWFCATFGRDALTTAWQALWVNPALAEGVLRHLASRQAREANAFFDAEPGKIMHEARGGEVCALGELPFSAYYGGVDTTPLFVALAGEHARRVGSTRLVEELWEPLERACGWIERRVGASRNGLLDYERAQKTGLANQGWKDSGDSVSRSDGSLAEGPVALIEAQGLAWRALREMSDLAERLGKTALSRRWRALSEQIAERVESLFWQPAQGLYAMAIDGSGAWCGARSSNVGHLLWMGLPRPERARACAEEIMSPDLFTGWGIRTLSDRDKRFNPMSYHNGSVWPHDTAICAMGLRQSGDASGPLRLMEGLLAAAQAFNHRLPELFCGFPRRAEEPPVGYPVACLPQAWSAGCALMGLQACLGVEIDGWAGKVRVKSPRLPAQAQNAWVESISLPEGRVSLRFERDSRGRVECRVDGDEAGKRAVQIEGD
jgi:glycogen debranching enzyme